VILVDANLLIYAVNADSHHHRAARRWLEETMSGTTPVGLAWIVSLAFLRITTRPGVFQHPITPERALDYVDSWLRQPCDRARRADLLHRQRLPTFPGHRTRQPVGLNQLAT